MKLNIHFKNVGQGDTLFFDWEDLVSNGNKKFGLIDCNLHNGGIDTVIDHITMNKIKEFEFVMMTHPHSDHFSGFLKLLDYCEENKITINKFLHTAAYDPKYLSAILHKEITKKDLRNEVTQSVNRGIHKNILWKLYRRLRSQHKLPNGFITKVKILSADSVLDITDDIKLRFLAPEGYDELDYYFEKMYSGDHTERVRFSLKYENNPYGNFLSSMIQVYSTRKDWQILLCSDVTKETLAKIIGDKPMFSSILNKRLLAAQIPHHGSVKNHVPDFWSQLKEISNAHILISVGEGYGHPDSSVIRFFDQYFLKVHATNFVGGYKKYFDQNFFRDTTSDSAALMDLPGVSAVVSHSNFKPKGNAPKCCEKVLALIIDGTGQATCDVEDAIDFN